MTLSKLFNHPGLCFPVFKRRLNDLQGPFSLFHLGVPISSKFSDSVRGFSESARGLHSQVIVVTEGFSDGMRNKRGAAVLSGQ